MRLSLLLCTVLIVCMLVVGTSAAQPANMRTKITPLLADKIKDATAGEELPLIVFFKKNETGFARKMMQNMAVSMVKSHGGKVKHRYMLIDAISAKMPASRITELASDSNIERIYYDKIYKIPPEQEQNYSIKLDVSTKTLGADYAWNTLGITGSGITVAVIDTGIDYNHPDLGGGWGNRVVGGYDFSNDDANPMDDNGHGTHVAGTIGANGTLKGVAPNVKLLAVKVLNNAGEGSTADIIAGIDWAVASGADIISMSLGENDQPNDEFSSPSTIIIDAAVDAGVVAVIAAGNEGPGTGTTASPGTGKKVITVGASDDKGTVDISDDTIIYFSNRGPSAFGRLDPDLAAPGVGINSTCIASQGTYCVMSGTSMATPHVSGAAALLLQEDPSLAPAGVRAALMHTANDLTSSSFHVFEKGAGMIDVAKALTYNISASINGDDRWEESIIPGFTATTELMLNNRGASVVNFTFAFEQMTDLEDGGTVSTSNFALPSFVVVAAGSSETVKINFSAPADASADIYGTTLIVTGDNSEELRIPVVITIPLVDDGRIHGKVDDDYNLPSEWGDWIYYKIKSHNGTSVTAMLNWDNSSYDLDLYLYAPNGELVDHGWYSYPEHVSVTDMAYDEYWLAVHAWDTKNMSVPYDLTVTYDSGLDVTPSALQGAVTEGKIKNVTFTITNGPVAKPNLKLSVKRIAPGESSYSEDTINGGSGSIGWKASTSGMDLSESRYLNVTLLWNDYSNDLDMGLYYYSGGIWRSTRFKSWNNNSQLGDARESLENIDILYYLKNYPDFGVGIKNAGSFQDYNLTLNFTDVAPWNAVSINETVVSLGASETKQVEVSFDSSGLASDKTYDALFVVQDDTTSFATVPIRVNIIRDITPPVITFVPPTDPSGITLTARNYTNINITLSESGTSWMEWNSINESMIGGNTAWYKNKTNLANGNYTYRVWANDSSGNLNVSETRTVTVNVSAPQNPVVHGTLFENITVKVYNEIDLVTQTVTGPGGYYEIVLPSAANYTLKAYDYLGGYHGGAPISTALGENLTRDWSITGNVSIFSDNFTVRVYDTGYSYYVLDASSVNGEYGFWVDAPGSYRLDAYYNYTDSLNSGIYLGSIYPNVTNPNTVSINFPFIYGYIKDPSGAFVENASVRLENTALTFYVEMNTSADGLYGFWVEQTDNYLLSAYYHGELKNQTSKNVVYDSLTNVNLTITTLPKIYYNTSLNSGWNLISIPLEQDNWSITSVMASVEGNYTVVYTYINGVWKKSTAARNPLTDMSLEYGYWVDMSAPDTLKLAGTVPPATTINVTSGWNFAGYPSLTTQNITSVLSQVNYSVVYTYINGVWKKSTAARNPLTEFMPGYGYWIEANEAGSYEV